MNNQIKLGLAKQVAKHTNVSGKHISYMTIADKS